MALDPALQQELAKLAKGRTSFNEPMRDHTTIKIGGPADVWFEPADIDDLIAVTKWADEKGVRRIVFGNGSNTLVCDEGISGMVISMANFNQISNPPEGEFVVRSGAGIHLQHLLGWAAERGLSGLECCAGIPGTVGGAVIMNAGTAEGTIADTVTSIKVAAKARITEISAEKLKFGYRKLKLPSGAVIVEASFKLVPSDRKDIENKISKIKHKRKEVQPILWPSLGSVFKNPEKGPKAWKLIDECGLRGVRVGGARISNEHANWIINEGKATAKDVNVLINMIKDRVKEDTDINLETEIVIIGE